ncbi:hypothetical protein [Desertibacillus haloalkaliphilus]|uniref:hypothetical protein n=1 Tax=Desertibacillus haloalkaliphilus TaxID=1328930 RepID=UPI001C264D9B|nr:hypothetical protein [Desertibacillus haloalkaliphilus]MBU8908163.1 hypothetical protein [Desertibacillus haloalkaliphilus]
MEQIDLIDWFEDQEDIQDINQKKHIDAEVQEMVSPMAINDELDIGDRVKAIKPTADMDSEDYYYLDRFKGKKGVVTHLYRNKVVSYQVEFGCDVGVFHRDDLIAV